jgi:uncharacterized protein
MIRHFKKPLLLCLALVSITSCKDDAQSKKIPSLIDDIREVKIQNQQGQNLNVRLAIGPYETSLGLSGVAPDKFQDNQGLLFFFFEDLERSFWMPDTYFNLDIIFLDENLKILFIEKNIPAHPGRNENPPIPRTPQIKCRYVLEIKSNVLFGSTLRVGESLILKSEYSLENIRKFILKNYN